MNPWAAMADPQEFLPPHLTHPAAYGVEIEEFGRRLRAAHGPITTSRDSSRLLSLAEPATVPRFGRTSAARHFAAPFARARMWEQYADAHAGVCLVFDRHALLDPLVDDPLFESGPVRYTLEGFAGTAGAGQFDVGAFTEENAAEAVEEHVSKFREDFFFTKTTDWAAEHEFRVVYDSRSSDGAPHFHDFGDALRYVIVGARFPRWGLRGALDVVRSSPCSDVSLCQMRWQGGIPRAHEIRDERDIDEI